VVREISLSLQPAEQVHAQVIDVVLGAVDEAGLAPAHEIESEHIQPLHVDDAAVMAQAALCIKGIRLQPGVVRPKPRGEDHGTDALPAEIETQAGQLVYPRRCKSFRRAQHVADGRTLGERVEAVEHAIQLQVRHRALVAQRSREMQFVADGAHQAADQLHASIPERVQVERMAFRSADELR